MVTVLVMLLLIAVVLGGLTMLLNTQTGHHAQSLNRGDSDRALFVAESGLEAAHARLSFLLGAHFTNASCTGLAAHFGTTTVGDGSFTIAAVSTPSTCDNSSLTPCLDCAVTASAQVGGTQRTLSYGVALSATNGTTCNATAGQSCTNATAPPPSWKLNLSNTYADAAVGVFSLAARRQGNSSGALCTHAACMLEWTINAANGGNSVGNMGNAVLIPAGGSYVIYQQLSADFDLAEVGALFPALTAGTAPSLTGRYASGNPVPGSAAYWEEAASGSGGTVGKTADATGSTNNGTATNPATDTCTTAPAVGTKQLCTNWCYGGNTLVLGFGASATSAADELTGVSFGTDAGGQAVAMTRVAKYPNASIPNAPSSVYSEVWYAQNPEYLSSSTASNGGSFTAAAGVRFNANLGNGSNQMQVTGVQGGILTVGSVVRCASGNCPAIFGTVTIQSQLSGTSGGNGTYRLSANCSNPNCGNSVAAGIATDRLTVTAVSSGYLSVGDVVASTGAGTNITSGTTLTALPGGVSSSSATGNYTLSTAQLVTSRTMSAVGQTINLSSGSAVPAAGTLLAVRSGTGALQAQTRVLASPAPTATRFTIDKVPTTPLSAATLCGGTCAFFRQGATTTQFTLAKTAGTLYWGAGFLCLKDAGVPEVVNSSSTSAKRWTEVVVN